MGLIDVRGVLVIEPSFTAVGALGGGMVAVREGGKVAYIDCATGAWAIEPRFDFGLGFRDGMAAVNRGGEKVQGECRGGRWGFVALDGTFVTRPAWTSASDFGDGRGVVWTKSSCAVVDRAGETVFESKLVVSAYTNGLALMRVRDD